MTNIKAQQTPTKISIWPMLNPTKINKIEEDPLNLEIQIFSWKATNENGVHEHMCGLLGCKS